jgi:hypothetical protein
MSAHERGQLKKNEHRGEESRGGKKVNRKLNTEGGDELKRTQRVVKKPKRREEEEKKLNMKLNTEWG